MVLHIIEDENILLYGRTWKVTTRHIRAVDSNNALSRLNSRVQKDNNSSLIGEPAALSKAVIGVVSIRLSRSKVIWLFCVLRRVVEIVDAEMRGSDDGVQRQPRELAALHPRPSDLVVTTVLKILAHNHTRRLPAFSRDRQLLTLSILKHCRLTF